MCACSLNRFYAVVGGLLSYWPDLIGQSRRAADYVESHPQGEKPADLPVYAPTKIELVINVKTAKAIGLTVPRSLIARATTGSNSVAKLLRAAARMRHF